MKVTVEEIIQVLLRQVGDSRECPYCHESFIPVDATADSAFALWKKLKNKKGRYYFYSETKFIAG